ncbi:MAG: S-adenosylmethionine decarboxylase [Minisyncoccia bacterium]
MEQGKHLVIDVLTKKPDKLSDKKFTRKFFKIIIKEIEMKAVLPIILYQFPSLIKIKRNIKGRKGKKGKGGITAFCILEESHISCHSWPEENYIAYDIYSCRNFDEKKVINLLYKYLPIENLTFKVIMRSVQKLKTTSKKFH